MHPHVSLAIHPRMRRPPPEGTASWPVPRHRSGQARQGAGCHVFPFPRRSRELRIPRAALFFRHPPEPYPRHRGEDRPPACRDQNPVGQKYPVKSVQRVPDPCSSTTGSGPEEHPATAAMPTCTGPAAKLDACSGRRTIHGSSPPDPDPRGEILSRGQGTPGHDRNHDRDVEAKPWPLPLTQGSPGSNERGHRGVGNAQSCLPYSLFPAGHIRSDRFSGGDHTTGFSRQRENTGQSRFPGMKPRFRRAVGLRTKSHVVNPRLARWKPASIGGLVSF